MGGTLKRGNVIGAGAVVTHDIEKMKNKNDEFSHPYF